MRVTTKRLVPLLLAAGLTSAAMAAPPVLLTGDGMGLVTGYDRGQKIVLIGMQKVGLSPTAAVALEQQLAQLGLASTQRFAAKFNIMPSADGRLVIESIYVVPPPRK